MKAAGLGGALVLAVASVVGMTWRPTTGSQANLVRVNSVQAPLAPALDRAQAAAQTYPDAAAQFQAACGTCHGSGAAMARHGPLWRDDPRDALKIMLQGLQPPAGASGIFMPAFGETLADPDLAQLAAYMRARFTDRPA